MMNLGNNLDNIIENLNVISKDYGYNEFLNITIKPNRHFYTISCKDPFILKHIEHTFRCIDIPGKLSKSNHTYSIESFILDRFKKAENYNLRISTLTIKLTKQLCARVSALNTKFEPLEKIIEEAKQKSIPCKLNKPTGHFIISPTTREITLLREFILSKNNFKENFSETISTKSKTTVGLHERGFDCTDNESNYAYYTELHIDVIDSDFGNDMHKPDNRSYKTISQVIKIVLDFLFKIRALMKYLQKFDTKSNYRTITSLQGPTYHYHVISSYSPYVRPIVEIIKSSQCGFKFEFFLDNSTYRYTVDNHYETYTELRELEKIDMSKLNSINFLVKFIVNISKATELPIHAIPNDYKSKLYIKCCEIENLNPIRTQHDVIQLIDRNILHIKFIWQPSNCETKNIFYLDKSFFPNPAKPANAWAYRTSFQEYFLAWFIEKLYSCCGNRVFTLQKYLYTKRPAIKIKFNSSGDYNNYKVQIGSKFKGVFKDIELTHIFAITKENFSKLYDFLLYMKGTPLITDEEQIAFVNHIKKFAQPVTIASRFHRSKCVKEPHFGLICQEDSIKKIQNALGPSFKYARTKLNGVNKPFFYITYKWLDKWVNNK